MSHLAPWVPTIPSVKYASNLSIILAIIVAMLIVIVVIMIAITIMTLELGEEEGLVVVCHIILAVVGVVLLYMIIMDMVSSKKK